MTNSDQPSSALAETGTGEPRCGFVAIVGAPNAGKSTLVNALVSAKVSIVSRKVQTTRVPVRGIVMAGTTQIVLIDTPGIFSPRRRLDRAMVEAATSAAGGADLVVLLVDAAKGVDDDVSRILATLAGVSLPRLLVLNKVDRMRKEGLLALAADLNGRLRFEATFMISALKGGGVDDLRRGIADRMPEGPWHFPPDDLSDVPERVLAAEITREEVYERLHQELPYSAAVETTGWEEFRNGAVRIEQTILVERDTQRAIVLGEGGRTIREISTRARKQLAALLERPVHLFLTVKVAEGWADDPERYRAMGLDFPKS